MKYLKRLLSSWRENFETILIFGAIAGFFLSNLIPPLQEELAKYLTALTLAILGLVAYSNIVNRFKVEDLQTKLEESINTLFVSEFPDSLQHDLLRGKTIWLTGVSLARFVRSNYSLLENKVRQGCKMRVLLVRPDGEAIRMTTIRVYKPTTVEQQRAEVLSSLNDLANLRGINPANVEIRVIDYPLNYGVRVIDPDAHNGVIYVEHYAFKTDDATPRFILSPKDGVWYERFRQEVTNQWNYAKEWQPSLQAQGK